jgi:1,4-alpha-glucan branching enzyme
VAAAVGEYAPLAATLGRRIGAMHVALASRPEDPAFAPEPLDHGTWEGIVASVRRDLSRALDALGAQGGHLPDAARESLASVRRRASSFAARLEDIEAQGDAGVRMRIHGDLHLGQVLFTGDDFVIIDFEGEPSRSLEQRKAKRSPLVDVAGMLRSFHYASVSALRARPEAAQAALAPWAALWQHVVSASFLRGWLAAVKGTVVVPRRLRVTRALLDLFLLEKGLYEVHYEMNNRPDWVGIPLEGLQEIVTAERNERSARGNTPVPTTRPSQTSPPRAVIDPASPAVVAFLHGKATHAHALLGAHPHQDGATDFAVWAPHAARVTVIGDFNGWTEGEPLARVGSTGIVAGRVRGAQPGHRYKYRIVPSSNAPGDFGTRVDKADPFARSSEAAPGNASVIASLTYAWGDDTWMENRFQNSRLDRPMSVYEVHLGSWRRKVDNSDQPLGYREIAAALAAYAKEMGFTHVELMPVLEHPFYGSWGYGVTGFFAATSRYGSPVDLMFLVDTLHQAGLGVIFDWVPAHFARDTHGLAMFDGGPLFEPEDRARAVHPTWDTGLFDFAKPEVRSFLLSSAIYWIETFHADGLRVDGVASMLYRDHSGIEGGAENEAGIAFLRQLTSTLKIEHPEVILAAEDSSAWPGVTRAASEGGLGFDLKWDMGFAHDMRRYLAIDPIQRSHHQGLLTFRSVYLATESFLIPLAHDDVIEERGGSLLAQMHGDPWQKFANLRLLYASAWTQPGKKLLFMGNELAPSRAWHHDRSLDWDQGRELPHSGIARMVGDLNRLHRELPALHAGDATPGGFEWIDATNASMSVIAFLRRGHGDEDIVLVACNFTPVPRHQYRIGVPRSGPWREVFSSDATIYGGSGHGNMGGVEAVPYPWNGRPASVVVTLPPLAAIILARG